MPIPLEETTANVALWLVLYISSISADFAESLRQYKHVILWETFEVRVAAGKEMCVSKGSRQRNSTPTPLPHSQSPPRPPPAPARPSYYALHFQRVARVTQVENMCMHNRSPYAFPAFREMNEWRLGRREGGLTCLCDFMFWGTWSKTSNIKGDLDQIEFARCTWWVSKQDQSQFVLCFC